MDLLVGWLDSSSSIGIFSIIISCRKSSQVDVEEWEYPSWNCCTLVGRRVTSVRLASKGAHPDSKAFRFVDVFLEIDGE